MAERSVSDQLCSAAANGNLSDVFILLQNGADVNGFNRFERTALQVVKLGSTPVVEVLLKKGANPNLRDPVLNLTVTHDAARDGYVDTVSALLQNGADANLVDGQGNLPLHLAAKQGHLEVVKVLIEHTANLHASNQQGDTAAQLARRHNRMDVADFLSSK
ncbi:cyclin-dependent kinase 4 inhibitor C isoform X2 [Mastacembelus armatus]|uniref:Cyclin-dependent kinase inhibitor 2C (p18, inhibits CDK4) n=2 Tax=Mastacembelus armatus TaxID=205130 RepID=A0A3Q3RNQ7_9TELE|nr:cyclin-dependent kinase 4 inhibitor C isoform X2 [Mastacembelus armatus]